MTDTNGDELRCSVCNELGCYFSEDDGHFYCNNCNALVDDVVATGVADEDFINTGGGTVYDPHYTRHGPSIKSEPLDSDYIGPQEPADFGDMPKGVIFTEEDYYKSIRVRYVLGVQLLVQYQCEKLVEVFKVSPIICGIAGEVWLRFVASKRVFADDWANDVIKDSENQEEKKCKVGNNTKHIHEPRNLYKERMSMIWFKSLKKTIPLSSSLAISYLACHIAREAVLPSDIMKWAIEGELPYFGAYPKIKESIKHIERSYNHPSVTCPLEANLMFRPQKSLSVQKLESRAAYIAHSIGLNLPPVNFYAIASRYLKQLGLPVEKILPHACHIQEWATPPELWLSVKCIPTRVCVMSILIVAIRILYNINGFGKWETSLSSPDDSSMHEDNCNYDDKEVMSTSSMIEVDTEGISSSVHIFGSDCAELLEKLEKKYDNLNNRFEYSKDLSTYLQYCKDVVFAGLEPLYKDPSLIEELGEFYQKNRKVVEAYEVTSLSTNSSQRSENTFRGTQPHQTSSSTNIEKLHNNNLREIVIRQMKIDMEEHRFCYIPPRVKVKRQEYLHYRRKVAGDGAYTYIAHADYYILLRACAKVAQVDPRSMHCSVLSLERRLGWIENKIEECVQHCAKPPKFPQDFSLNKIS